MRLLFFILTLSLFSCKNKKEATVFKNENMPTYKDGGMILKTTNNLAADNLFPGQGFNSVTGQRMDAVVVDTPLIILLKSPTEKYGQSVELNFELVESYQDLRTKLGLDVTASLKMGIFKGKNELKLLESTSFNSFSSYFLVSLKVINPSLSLDPQKYQLTAKARGLLGDPRNFIRSFGNKFVTSVETGGTLYMLMEYKTNSKAEQKSLKNTLNANVKGLFGRAQIDATIQTEFNNIEYNKSQKIYMAGTGICDSFPPIDLPSLINYVRKFPDLVSLNEGCPSVFGVSTMDIATLSEITDKNIFNPFIQQRHYLEDCAYKKDSLLSVISNSKYVEEYEDEFSNPPLQTIALQKSQAENSLRMVTRLAEDCATNMSLCDNKSLEKITIPKIEVSWNQGEVSGSTIRKDTLLNTVTINAGGFYSLTTIPAGQTYRFEFTGKQQFNRIDFCYEPYISTHNDQNAWSSPSGPAYPVIELQLSDDDGTTYKILRQSEKKIQLLARHGNLRIQYGLFCYILNINSTNRACYPFTECEKTEVKIIKQ